MLEEPESEAVRIAVARESEVIVWATKTCLPRKLKEEDWLD
jgi:hypothetical protein